MLTSLLLGKRTKGNYERFLKQRAPIRSMPLHLSSHAEIRHEGNHVFFECGRGKPMLFSHGLFGGIFNIDKIADLLSCNYRFLMPFLPMYDQPLKKCRVSCLGEYLEEFIKDLELDRPVMIGSSMGGGAAAYLASRNSDSLSGLVLCGSSGISNIPLATGFFKRKNYSYVRSATQDIFYNRDVPCNEMTEDVFNALQDTELVIRSIRLTKSATQEKMHNELAIITSPTLLAWGKQDPITPVEVAPIFNRLIKNSELHIIEECGHVPTQEKPIEFLSKLYPFLKKINY